ncbi:MAG: hypothetical protein HY703_12865 [Gemmatimonadetes bacterium]|nr:hypothetical protein [Gemmatimonadota bacterium]
MTTRSVFVALAAAGLAASMPTSAVPQQPVGRRDTLAVRPPAVPFPPRADKLPATAAAAPRFRVEVGCSESELRTGVAALSWQADRKLLERQAVEVTVYKGGFEKGLSAVLSAVAPDRKFETSPGFKASGQQARRAFELAVDKVDFREKERLVSVQVKGLEPGLGYFWRVLSSTDKGWQPGETVQTEAPTCVADIIPPPAGQS